MLRKLGYGQQGRPTGYGMMGGGYYGNPQYDMQMPWMRQFNQSPWQNQMRPSGAPAPAPSYNVGTNSTVNTSGGQLSFADPMGVGVGNLRPQPSYNGGMTSTSGGQTSFIDPMGLGV